MSMRHRVVPVVIAMTAAILGTATSASAHAELDSSSPAAGSVLDASPSQIALTFSEAVDTVPDSLRLVSGDGSSIDIGDVRQANGSNSITADVPELAPGTYVVAWKAVSADSHVVNGAFTFSVGTVTPTKPGLLADVLQGESPNRAAEVTEGAGKAVAWLGLSLLVGATLIIVVFAPSLFTTRRAGWIVGGGGCLAVAGTLTTIAAQAWLTRGEPFGPSAWGDVARSASGRWWFVRLALIAIGLALVLARRRTAWALWNNIAAVVAVGSLAASAASGHAAAGRWQAGGLIATIVHLAAMCTWIGGLVTIVAVVPRHDVWSLARRFSPWALVSAAALVVTGLFNAWRQHVALDDVTASSYGRWLLVKVLVVVVVLAAAGVNRWLLAGNEQVEPVVRRIVAFEVAGAAIILAVTAGLTGSAPPGNASAAATGPAVVSVVQGDRIAQIILDPPVSGGTTMHVTITSTNSVLDQPDEVTVAATLPSENIGPLTIPMTAITSGHLTTDDAVLPLPGQWTITVSARYGQFELVAFTAEFSVR